MASHKPNRFFIKLISSFFYLGYLPVIPGTLSSLAGVGIFFLIQNNPALYAFLFFSLLILGFLTSGEAEKVFQAKDARYIVIDEICGMLLGLAFLPFSHRLVWMAFLLFRLLDALKPYPADKLQNLRGSLGVMSDDLVAGLYTNVILQFVVWRLPSLRIS